MRRILTSLPYERRIGLPGAAGGIPVTDSIRRTLLLPVADTHLDGTLESASGRLVGCDEVGHLLAYVKFHGYTDFDIVIQSLYVSLGVTQYLFPSGYKKLALFRVDKNFITSVHVTNSYGVSLQTLYYNKMILVPGIVGQYYLKVLGLAGNFIDVHHYYFK